MESFLCVQNSFVLNTKSCMSQTNYANNLNVSATFEITDENEIKIKPFYIIINTSKGI